MSLCLALGHRGAVVLIVVMTAACGTGDASPPTPPPARTAGGMSGATATGTVAPSNAAETMPATTTPILTTPPPQAAPPETTAPPGTRPPPGASPEAGPALQRGDVGAAVEAVQRRLAELGYWLGPADGSFGLLTQQAVYALQKVAGLERDGVVGPRTRAALDAGTRPSARRAGERALEVDLDRQVLLLVDGGEVEHVLNTSTGTFEHYTYGGVRYLADTPRGEWTITRQIDGWRESHLGRLYRPKYFHPDGIAVHGYTSVPPYAASHGCVRVTIPAIDWIWHTGRAPLGTPVRVY